jgi:hypothetical protein
VDRLNNGIPPNAIERGVDERQPAEMVEIINAAWFHKIGWSETIFNKDQTFNENIYFLRNRMNNLTLKAIEYSDVELDYLARNGVPVKFEDKNEP